MTQKKLEGLLQLLKQYGVSHYKSLELEIRMDSIIAPTKDGAIVPRGAKEQVPLQAAPPVEMPIPHHVNEVQQLLRLSDNELVDKLFPDFSQPQG